MNVRPLRILVTGTGGDLGQALVKSLRLKGDAYVVFGCDSNADGIGPAFVDNFVEIPHANHESYVNSVQAICREKNIDVVVPGSIPEIDVLSQIPGHPVLPCGTPVLCQGYTHFKTIGDKLQCLRMLEGKIELAPYADGADDQAIKEFICRNLFPCVVKPRFSSGSKNIYIANNDRQLLEMVNKIESPIVQQYIDDAYGEYSVGVFCCEDFTRMIAFRRNLGPQGASWYADNAGQDPDVIQYAKSIAKIVALPGSYNIQVRKSSLGVRLLEINPRFSSLVAARAVCGFTDLEWSISMALGRKMDSPSDSFKPIRFQRFLHEMIDRGEGYKCVAQWTPESVTVHS